jgi:hypothetical protein
MDTVHHYTHFTCMISSLRYLLRGTYILTTPQYTNRAMRLHNKGYNALRIACLTQQKYTMQLSLAISSP